MSEDLLIILGPTASGKTKLAVTLAHELNGEIISADSRQVFKDMDIGTGKDLNEYRINGKNIPYHLINIQNAGTKYHVNAFKEDFYAAFNDISQRKKLPILCGGTGMYIHSILQNHELTTIPVNQNLRNEIQDFTKEQLQDRLNSYSETLRLHADYSSAKRLIRAIEIADYLTHNELVEIARPTINPVIIGLQSEVETRRERIIDRLNKRLNFGLIEEVEALLKSGISKEMLIFYGLEYKFIASYLADEIDFITLKERLGIAICQFAKRQMTFFRKMEKDGVKIKWLNADENLVQLKKSAIGYIEQKIDLK
ncbi:tRNA (adenosine(37)-N6)-dimethylallyltransferase MiaA [Pedobacter boryungensis]|uniref:tRNA dimethylallyltransferase n=1 Tax=Pedobacter boryungensis TaxID=869962 RepID=A0ABX2D9I5_9SPHI|nr:tRNA (adenosine(37)-N6)-dimethylallyltransferase MiaA [Pedobacter boryungensis]NQX30718.1 tRNA (adenosine(37)-N6)-dimethylallyltransferase MiaA [Pedobacter boryungensis]